MTPKEKAQELYNEFSRFSFEQDILGIDLKDCILTCVDEILKAGSVDIVNQYFDDRYWMEVKKEIELL